MGIWHLTLSSVGRRVILDDEAQLLCGVHALARVAGRETVLFSFVDDHVHVVASTDRPGLLGAGLRRSLGAISPVELEPVHRREVAHRRHLEWLANDYILKQTAKHGVGGHPALWPGSCFLDLAGARRIPGFELQLMRVLPRYRLRNAFLAVGLEPVPLAPPGSAGLWAAGVARIVAASCAAVGAY